jgi:alpha-amylase
MAAQNPLLLQCFEWHTPSSPSSSHYSRLSCLIPTFSSLGVTLVWLPPGCKANNPRGNGYDIYDLWDLGEFEQKGARATKWGSREELDELLRIAKESGAEVVWDAVLNHKTGGDSKEETWAVEVDKEGACVENCGRLHILRKLYLDRPPL